MNLDLSKFKKVKDTKESAVLQHPDGHMIHLSKGGMVKKHQQDLSKLPLHMDVGGVVPGDGSDASILPVKAEPSIPDSLQGLQRQRLLNPEVSPESKLEILKTHEDYVKNEDSKKKVGEVKQAAEDQKKAKIAEEYNQKAAQYGLPAAQVPAVPDPAPIAQLADAGTAPMGLGAPSKNITGESTVTTPAPQQNPMEDFGGLMSGGAQGYLQGQQQQAQAEGALGKQNANILQQDINAQQKLMDETTAKMNQYEADNQKFVDAYQNGHIDPNRVMNSMGTGQRISTAIGLILGGMGAGITGGENPAMKFLNQQIENDIESQKQELGKKQNLLSYNMTHFGNMKDALAMTRTQLGAITASKIAKAAAIAQDPLAKARAMQASGEFLMKNKDAFKEIATNQVLENSMKNGSASDPVSMIKLRVPAEQQPKYFEELQKAQNAQNALQLAENAYDEMKQMSRAGALIPGSDAKTAWEAKKEEIAINLSVALGEKAERLKKSIDAMLPERLMESDSEIDLKKRSMKNLLQRNMSFPLLESIGANNFSRKMIKESAPRIK